MVNERIFIEKIRLGLIGIDNMGTIHANNVYGG